MCDRKLNCWYSRKCKFRKMPRKIRIQGCQMVYFQTKNPTLGKFWRALDWKMLICIMPIWNILWTFGIFYDHLVQFWKALDWKMLMYFIAIWIIYGHSGYFRTIWYIFPVLVSWTKKNLATLLSLCW
jgi:hypothetical protein